jgi:hypothetical protein
MEPDDSTSPEVENQMTEFGETIHWKGREKPQRREMQIQYIN